MSTSRYLEKYLKVKVNAQKSSICKVKEDSVLGFQIHRKKLRTIDLKIRKFKSELRRISRRCPGIAMKGRLQRLAEYARGWMTHYGCGMLYNIIVEMEGWIRRRIRMAYFKQWRKPRTKIRELIKLGVPVKLPSVVDSAERDTGDSLGPKQPTGAYQMTFLLNRG